MILFSRGKSTDNTIAANTSDSSAVRTGDNRVINFYNPSEDTLVYLAANQDGLISQEAVAPGHVKAILINEGYYILAGLTTDNKNAITLPNKKYADDKAKYKIFKDEKGEFVQRFVKAGTPEENDYTDAWLVLDGKQDLAFVDVTEACSKSITKEQIKSTDWVSKIHSTYDAVELMEPEFTPASANEKITVIDPDQYIPASVKKGETVYLAVPVPAGTKADNETIARIVDESVKWE